MKKFLKKLAYVLILCKITAFFRNFAPKKSKNSLFDVRCVKVLETFGSYALTEHLKTGFGISERDAERTLFHNC